MASSVRRCGACGACSAIATSPWPAYCMRYPRSTWPLRPNRHRRLVSTFNLAVEYRQVSFPALPHLVYGLTQRDRGGGGGLFSLKP
jgi:hypothetical protein